MTTTQTQPTLTDTVSEVACDWVFSDPFKIKNGSTVMYAHMTRPNGMDVIQRCVSPPFLSKYSPPFSEYMVACGVDYVNEITPVSRAKAVKDILAKNPEIDQAALKAGELHLYESWLYWKFSDINVEHAIAFADSLAVLADIPADENKADLQSNSNSPN